MNHPFLPLALALASLITSTAYAEVVTLEVLRREPFADGKAFGDTGAYEKIVGIARFAVDPLHTRNDVIVDLKGAPRNAGKKVEFEADVTLLVPKDPAKGNGAVFYDVNNRGSKRLLYFFNSAVGDNDPDSVADAGNGFLFRRGYTVAWCGWIGELQPGGGRSLLRAPIATDDGKPIRGIVRQEMVVEAPVDSVLLSRRPNHGSYPPSEDGLKNATLTWRMRETDERVLIPRGQWTLERGAIPPVKQGVPGTLPPIRLKVVGGIRPGYIYELIYEGEGPIVQGLGYAATRDLISFLKYSSAEQNPVRAGGKPVIKRAHAFGVSQSGRFLRNFLHLGFNVDEANRKVFDGLIPHVAGAGLGFFNHRFAQPNRHNGQHEDHLFPADYFPFTYGDTLDNYLQLDGTLQTSNQTGSIQQRTGSEDPRLLPKVMHTQSAAEYWHRSGSLVHTDTLGQKDVDIPDNVRIYAFGGTQHGPASDPPGRGPADNLTNPGDYRPQLRALIDALDAWARDGVTPPPSMYPRIDQGTLVDFRQKQTGFPALPGVRYPEVIQRPAPLDLGPDFKTRGVISVEPPRILGHYVVLVPKSGPDGNDLGTLLPAEVAVPLATYTGWNLRRRDVGAEGMLASLMGSYIPFARTKTERTTTGDPRPSLEERYGDFEHYQKQFAANCQEMVKRRVLLQEDADRLIANRAKLRGAFVEKAGAGK